MGVVYEAEDQRLGRSVAIKLLPEATRQDPAALERFWREARTASSLNHPGICTIHELNESGDQPFIVMELLQGQSLDKLYYRRPMPYAKLLDFGVQAADALDAAHRKGVLHRDIKPGNIFLSPSGQVKILDFGLAKLEDAAPGNARGENATLAGPVPQDLLTSPGSAIGTIAYMSPEQARGETLDARSDVFSLGVVLYELATGQHPFSGATTASAVRDGQFCTPYVEILDLESHRIVHRLPQGTSGFTQGMPSFSPDGKGFVEQVATKDGNALLYQPIDGSATHLLTNPTHDTLTDFAWSPSGSRLGALQLRQNSDVVLITDVGGKQPH